MNNDIEKYRQILSRIASKNEGYYWVDPNNNLIHITDPEFDMKYYQIFYTFGGKVYDYETNELLYENGKLMV